jgi:hypothetical protein
MRTSKLTSAILPDAPGPPPFRVEKDFSAQASALRLQFEERLSLSAHDNAGITPLTYVFSENRYCFLTASAEQIFTTEVLQDFIERLHTWGHDQFGSEHVSTPQVRVYINGCGREVLQDNVMLGWHYTLSLTHGDRPAAVAQIRVLVTNKAEDRGSHFGVCEFVSLQLPFNHLLVHETQNSYGVELLKSSSMNPLKGSVFLDGYLW